VCPWGNISSVVKTSNTGAKWPSTAENGFRTCGFRPTSKARRALASRRSAKPCSTYLNGDRCTLTQEFIEVESGKRSDRPQLTAALAACKKQKAKLVIAKLDRLARNVHFISGLMDAGVEFVACDMPHANKLTIHILAAVAEHEREAISARTKAALAAAKARGKKLGGPKLAIAAKLGSKANKAAADRFAANVLPVILQVKASGATSLRAVAAALTARGVPTARGGDWNAAQVANVMRRAT
jgi:DNA invertase Pin-like site-specific DNA recombinase